MRETKQELDFGEFDDEVISLRLLDALGKHEKYPETSDKIRDAVLSQLLTKQDE